MHHLTLGIHIIVITVNFNQARIGKFSVDIVTQHTVIVPYDAILVRCALNELAICVKGIGSFLHQAVHSGAVVCLVHDQLAFAVDIVVIITNFDHARRSLNAINIVIEVFAIFQNSVLAGVLVMQDNSVFIEVVAPFRKRKAIGLVEPAILAVQHSALHRCREGQALTLIQILLNCEVIIVDLAVLLDNALQTGFFFDDAAVEPIGIISDAVNTGNVALEYAVCVEDAARFFVSVLRDQRSDTRCCVSGFGVQIVGFAVNDCPACLLQFAVLVVLLAVIIRKPTVGVLPACLETQIGEGQERFFIPFFIIKFIGLPNTVTHGAGNKPTVEVITFAGKITFGKHIRLIRGAIGDFYGVHCTVTTVGVEGNSQLFKLVVHRRENNVLMRVEAPAVDLLRLIIGSPAPRKDVGIVLVLGFWWYWMLKIIIISIFLAGVVAFLQNLTVPVEPADMILVQLPLGVEGDIFVGGDVCLVGIGRAGAVLRRVPTVKVIVSSGESIGRQCGRHAGIHSLRAHISLAAVGVKGYNRFLRPLRIERGINIEIHCCSVGIIRTCAVSLGIPAGKRIALTSECVVCQLVTNAGVDAHGLHAARTAVRVKGNGDFVALERPFAVGVHIGGALLGTGSPCIGAVCVVQLCGSNGDFRISNFSAKKIYLLLFFNLICCCFLAEFTLLDILTGSIGGADIRTACGGINAAACGQCSVDVHLCIDKRRTGACPAGCVDHRNILRFTGTTVAAPLVHIIDIDALSAGHL